MAISETRQASREHRITKTKGTYLGSPHETEKIVR
jgi:hypothetical protein